MKQSSVAGIMIPDVPNGAAAIPADVLIVEDDPIIAIDFEDRLLDFGVRSVRTVGSVAQAWKRSHSVRPPSRCSMSS
jgi:hypothetical protein